MEGDSGRPQFFFPQSDLPQDHGVDSNIMTMQYSKYWDLTVRERAALTEEQMDAFCAHALMEAGVVQMGVPEYAKEIQVTPPTTRYFVPQACGDYSTPDSFGIGFEDPEAAAEFCALLASAVKIKNDWQAECDYAAPLTDISSADKNVMSAQVHAEHKAQLEQLKATKAQNTTKRDAYAKALKAANDCTEELWADYRSSQDKVYQLTVISQTFDQYKGMAKDEAAALVFLRKAYKDEDIREALSAELFDSLTTEAVPAGTDMGPSE